MGSEMCIRDRYKPPALTVPKVVLPKLTPFTCHVTALVVPLVTVAVNCRLRVVATEAVAGVRVMVTGALLPPQPGIMLKVSSARKTSRTFNCLIVLFA